MTMIKPYKKCKKCGALIVSGNLCEDCKPMTNADRIRQMTDDEELLSAIGTGCYRCAYNNGECGSEYGEGCGCIEGNLEWLKQEVQNDDER